MQISTDPTRLDITRIHRWLSTDTPWAHGRSLTTVRTSIKGSLPFGAYTDAGEQIGFARVVTDGATFAWLCDVYIDRAHRGHGIGSTLARAVVDELAPLNLTRVLLSTIDAHEVYARVGFTPLPEPAKFMVLTGPTRPPC